MKHLICIPLLCMLPSITYCQPAVSAIQTDKNKVLYMGVDNPLTLAVEHFGRNKTFLTTDNGVMPPSDNGHYVIRPAHTGVANLNVKAKNSHSTIDMGTYRFMVKPLPDPVLTFNGKTGGEIPVETARKLKGPEAKFTDFDLDAKFIIERFTIMVIRNQQLALMKTIHNADGVTFNDDLEVMELLQSLKGGEKLIFSEITCTAPGGVKHHLQPIEFRITNAD